MASPRYCRRWVMGIPAQIPTREPPKIPATGARIKSALVFPSISRTSSMAVNAAKKAPRGSAFPERDKVPSVVKSAPEANSSAKAPTVPAIAAQIAARELSPRRVAIPMPIPAPVRDTASCPR